MKILPALFLLLALPLPAPGQVNSSPYLDYFTAGAGGMNVITYITTARDTTYVLTFAHSDPQMVPERMRLQLEKRQLLDFLEAIDHIDMDTVRTASVRLSSGITLSCTRVKDRQSWVVAAPDGALITLDQHGMWSFSNNVWRRNFRR